MVFRWWLTFIVLAWAASARAQASDATRSGKTNAAIEFADPKAAPNTEPDQVTRESADTGSESDVDPALNRSDQSAIGISPPTSRATPEQPVSLTVSGGVSLGSYMAGFVYLLSELVKRPDAPARLVLSTGASAGSANALVAVLNSCLPPNPDPMQDLGWRVWSRADYRTLFVEDEVTATSLLSRRVLHEGIDLMQATFRDGLPKSCDAVVGFSATRVEPYEVELAEGFSIPRLSEKFAFRMRGQGAGKIPKLSNYIDPGSAVEQPLLPFSASSGSEGVAEDFDRVRELMLASGAFPFAFPRQSIKHCLSDPETGDKEPPRLDCVGEPIRSDAFVDGGVFDNTPLRLAYRLAQIGLRSDHGMDVTWCDLKSESSDEGLADRVDYIYLDPGLSVYPPFLEDSEELDDALLPLAVETLGGWIQGARSRELYSLVEQRETLSTHMRLTRTHYPPASNLLGAFLGFFDWKFRHFDFYLGIYDALKFFQSWAKRNGREIPIAAMLPDGRVARNWEPFACMVSYYEEGFEQWRPFCDGPELEDFRILLQISLDRVYSHCAELDPKPRGIDHLHCRRAARGEASPRIVRHRGPDGASRLNGETHFEHVMRLLDDYRFEFSDLGLERHESNRGRVKLRRKMLRMTNALAERQEGFQRELVLTASRGAINQIAYEPPKNWLYLTVGSTSEFGASLLPFEWDRSWARLNMALNVDDLLGLLTLETDEMVLRAVAGPELQLLFITTPAVQPLIGARVGVQLGAGDDFGTADCTAERAEGDSRLCSGPVIQGYGAINLVERFRLQFTGTWTREKAFGSRQFELGVSFGLQFF